LAHQFIKAVGENPCLTASEKSVLMCLGWRADNDGVCYPSINHIAQWTSLAVNTVRTTLKKVEGYGCFRREERQGQSAYYFLNMDAIKAYTPTKNVTPTKIGRHKSQ
jgi:hypothetical protein